MIDVISTKLYKNNQTVVPKEIRKKYNLNEDTVIEWIIEDNGEVKLNFRKKVTVDDIFGSVHLNEKTNAVKLKRGLYL